MPPKRKGPTPPPTNKTASKKPTPAPSSRGAQVPQDGAAVTMLRSGSRLQKAVAGAKAAATEAPSALPSSSSSAAGAQVPAQTSGASSSAAEGASSAAPDDAAQTLPAKTPAVSSPQPWQGSAPSTAAQASGRNSPPPPRPSRVPSPPRTVVAMAPFTPNMPAGAAAPEEAISYDVAEHCAQKLKGVYGYYASTSAVRRNHDVDRTLIKHMATMMRTLPQLDHESEHVQSLQPRGPQQVHPQPVSVQPRSLDLPREPRSVCWPQGGTQ